VFEKDNIEVFWIVVSMRMKILNCSNRGFYWLPTLI
jgi:hypothetical protein